MDGRGEARVEEPLMKELPKGVAGQRYLIEVCRLRHPETTTDNVLGTASLDRFAI